MSQENQNTETENNIENNIEKNIEKETENNTEKETETQDEDKVITSISIDSLVDDIIKCDVCKGTGIKPKTSFPIKWVKFWFDKDKKTDEYIKNTFR